MSYVFKGPALPVFQLTKAEREELAAELAWLETDLVRRRAERDEWAGWASLAEKDLTIPRRLYERAVYWFDRSNELVRSGEQLRAMLIGKLQSQEEHAPAYHYAN